MVDLSAESIHRVADARRDAETELKKALSGVKVSDDVAPYLSAVTSFASALFDAEAGELLTVCEDADGFRTAIENGVAPRIIEGILPDRSLTRVAEHRRDEVKRLSIKHDMDTGLLWEVGPDGNRKPARAEVRGIYARHGDWENFMPKGVRFLVRLPSNNATVRAALCQTLQQRVDYWAGQFHMRATAGGNAARTRLRRVAYPFPYWLYDHPHQPTADAKAELDYWKAHVCRGYHVLVENYERVGMGYADRYEKLTFATAGLSYDLAVLQANYSLHRGLRGDEATRIFLDEAAGILEEITSSWRASCERLAVTFDDDTEEVRNLAQPFYRVGDDLRRLLGELRPESARPTQGAAPPTKGTVSGTVFPRRAAWLKARLAEREWSVHDLQRHGGPEHRTTQKVLYGFAVNDDVLRKVIVGLQSKPAHKGQTLPGVAESDIPND